MKVWSINAALLAIVATFAGTTAGDVLKVGDPAPALAVGNWVKGEPVSGLDKGKTYVVEFWATWCGPCKATIPHLTELARTYPQVTFIGTSISETDDTAVEPFVAAMGDQMVYHVATDDKSSDPEGAMKKGWMEAAAVRSIPTAFVVNEQNQIAWIGHPIELDQVLKDITAGKYDMEAAIRQSAIDAKEREAEVAWARELNAKVSPSLRNKDYDAALKALDELGQSRPDKKAEQLRMKMTILLRAERFEEAYRVADDVAALNHDDAGSLNELAWFIAANKSLKQRDLARAEKYATRAVELTGRKDAGVLDTLARVHFEKGEVEQAVTVQKEAMAIADESVKAEFAKALEEYQAALQK